MIRYVAKRRLRIEGGKFIEPGEPVPSHWPNLKQLASQLRIVAVTEPEPEPEPAVAAAPPAPATPPPAEPPEEQSPVGGRLRAALARNGKGFTKAALIDLAKDEGIDLPAKLPKTKVALMSKLSEILGPEG